MRLSEVRTTLTALGVHPSRSLGQNFLIDANILDILLEAAAVSPKDVVLEVGPGLGAVTEALLDRARRVIAVEKDRRLSEYLGRRFEGRWNLDLVRADFLDLDVESVLQGKVDGGDGGVHSELTGAVTKVVANLPYSVGSRILIDLAMAEARPSAMVVTVQQEVAARLASGAGDADYGKLSVWMQLDFTITRVKTISPTCFWPVPEVKSEIVALTRNGRPPLDAIGRRWFRDLTTEAFAHRRKQLGTILNRSPWGFSPGEVQGLLGDCGLDLQVRPEAVSVESWCSLARGAGTLR